MLAAAVVSWALAVVGGGGDAGDGGGESCAERDAGWRGDAAFEASWWGDSRCTIARLDAPPRIEELRAGRPFIYRSNKPNARMQAALARPELLRTCGEVAVGVGSAAELAANGRGARSTTLAAYGRAMRGGGNSSSSGGGGGGGGGERAYFFDDGTFLSRCAVAGGAGPLRTLYKPALPFSRLIEYADAPLLLALGGSGSGIPFHEHRDAFNEVLVGAKRWSLYPPGAFKRIADAFGFDPRRPHLEWLRTVLPTLPPAARPLECVQRAGEVLFIPRNWFHATLNMGETVAVAQQPVRLDANNMFG
jgi:hypothetical protein